jgi:uncharacterized membrane protein (DUF2068 family)
LNPPSATTTPVELAATPPRDAALRLVILWKSLKATSLAAVATLLALPGQTGLRAVEHLSQLAEGAGAPWLQRLGEMVERRATATGVALTAALAAAAAGLMLTEAIGLHYRRRWAAWLTVVATLALVPLELFELARRPRPWTAAALLLNLLVAAYLYRKARRDSSIWKG